jgi:hypothetical protein
MQPHLRPSYAHQRRDSDTLRSVPQTLSTSGSVTAVEREPSQSALPQRISPSGRESNPSRYHRRNPTAPEAPTTSGLINPPGLGGEPGVGKTWAAGDGPEKEGNGEPERETNGRGHGQPQANGYGHHKQQSEVVLSSQIRASRQAPLPPPASAPPSAPSNQPVPSLLNSRPMTVRAMCDLLA